MREGNHASPTREPIDWRSPAFHDAAAATAEMERVFDICHGCRRCVNLCRSFPTLFDLIDATAEGEVHAVARADHGKVVDQCYQCDLCFMAKCPYTPPHPWRVDFPHLMLRAKAVRRRAEGVPSRDALLASTDLHGRFAGIPVVVDAVNAATRSGPARRVMEAALGVHRDAWLPELARRLPSKGRAGAAGAADPATLSGTGPPAEPQPQSGSAGARRPCKVAIFATCWGDHHEPALVEDLIKVLDHNAVGWEIVAGTRCCGMPRFELGDLPAVERAWAANVPLLAPYARAGWAVLAPLPSCTLMFKQTLPLMFGDDADTRQLAAAVFDPFEYLVARHRDGLLKTDFVAPLGRVSYHVACHARVQNIGRKAEELLRLVGATVDVTLHTVERCSGHGGSYGFRKATHPNAMKIGRPVFAAMAQPAPDRIASDCPMAAHHIAQGMAQAGTPPPNPQHPLTLLRIAYGLP